ncbi:hypothetical protein FRB99_000420 [Tulasnella sp. 403]|nr:hypothetical protein FRB99_000420 [Tulasnella sp. 403]
MSASILIPSYTRNGDSSSDSEDFEPSSFGSSMSHNALRNYISSRGHSSDSLASDRSTSSAVYPIDRLLSLSSSPLVDVERESTRHSLSALGFLQIMRPEANSSILPPRSNGASHRRGKSSKSNRNAPPKRPVATPAPPKPSKAPQNTHPSSKYHHFHHGHSTAHLQQIDSLDSWRS